MQINITTPHGGELVSDALMFAAMKQSGTVAAWLYELAAEALDEARSRSIGSGRRSRYRELATEYRNKAQALRLAEQPIPLPY